MSEQYLVSAQTRLSFTKRYFWIIWAIGAFVIIMLLKSDGESFIMSIGIAGVFSLILYFYLLMKYSAEVKALGNYVGAQRNKNFSEALGFSMQYCLMRRKGIAGADGSGLTIYDEQAISNDIAAYS